MFRVTLPVSSPRQGVIRVFASSTFRDMQEEREELGKQILARYEADYSRDRRGLIYFSAPEE